MSFPTWQAAFNYAWHCARISRTKWRVRRQGLDWWAERVAP